LKTAEPSYELLNGGSPSSNKIILFYLRVR
jgi:hypothetical protein